MSDILLTGHETFHCRHFWLKKGYDFIKNGHKFSDSSAVVELGVGKNMVKSIKYWLTSFNIIDNTNSLTPISNYLFNDNGKDPYLEDPVSVWLLHYYLIKSNNNSFFSLIFNEFRKERIEFSKQYLLSFFINKFDEFNMQFSDKTLNNSINIFIKSYCKSISSSKNIENDYSGLLMELDILRSLTLKSETHDQLYKIEITDRKELPPELLLFAILDNPKYNHSISFYELLNDFNGIGNIFLISANGLINKLNMLMKQYPFMIFTENTGIRELQFKSKPDKWEILNKYYAA